MIEIEKCNHTQIRDVMSFIDRHWSRGHALAVCKDLMDWQHGSADGSYDYLIARDDRKIWGVLGYISTRRFDEALNRQNVVWLALWKVIDEAPVGLGLRLLHSLSKFEPHIAVAVNGINSSHPPMYDALGYEVGELQQFFVTNPNRSMSLLSAPSGYSWPVPSPDGIKWDEMDAKKLREMDPSIFVSNTLPLKSPAYFATRFFGHPVYRYRVFSLVSPNGDSALIATRVAEHNGARALRVVDFAGNPAVLRWAGNGLTIVLEESGAEYADLWAYGMDQNVIAATGMIPVNQMEAVIVPNFFEPFISKNGRILCAVKRVDGGALPVTIFRADGDQDRPNLIKPADLK